MKRITHLLVLLGMSISLGGFAHADTLRLADGSEIEGTFLGGDSREIRFLTSEGLSRAWSISDVAGVAFTSGQQQAPTVASAAATSRPSSPARERASEPRVTVPVDTAITVRLIDSIDTDRTGVAERFRASIDDPVVVGGNVTIPRGADATVQVMRVDQAGTLAGSDEVAIKLFDITVDGRTYEVAGNYAEVKTDGKGKQTAKTTALTTGIGAVLGGILGGGKGAAIGAGAGAGTGVAVSSARGKRLRVPSETRLEFVLRAPLPID